MARGAQTELAGLIALRHAARDLRLFERQRARQRLAGAVRTHFRGRGIEFEEVRAYQPGDEIRAIDWRVTARTGEAHTRLFREERERPVLIAVDQRANMAFGTRRCFKSVQAAVVASLLGWAALAHSDRIGGLVYGDSGHDDIRPRRSRHALLAFLHALHERNHQALDAALSAQPPRINQALRELRRITRPGSAVFIVSDFDGLNDEGLAQLQLLKRHNDLTAIAVYDPMEARLPSRGGQIFTDRSGARCRVQLGDRALAARFGERFDATRSALRRDLAARGVPLIEVATDQGALAALSTYYAARQPSRKVSAA